MTLGKGGTNCGVLKKCFDLQGKEIVSIVGSGGKTSLMWALAKTYRKEAVLVSTTTKIGFQRQLYDYFYTNHFENNAEYLRNHFSRNRYQQPNKTNDACNDLVSNIVSALHESFRSGWVQTTTFERLVLL